MKIADCMTQDVRIASPTQTLQEVAQAMAGIDAGVLPVAEGDRLVGMITDRDITIRAVAQGLGPDALVKEVMTTEVLYTYDHHDVQDVLRNMANVKVRRLPVVNRDKRLVGIVSLSDLCTGGERPPTTETLREIAKPGGPHSQTIH
jgi:CBS domain-containing protein